MTALWLALALAAEPPQALTRREALARAASSSPELVPATRELDIARAGVRSAGALPNPTLAGSYGPDEPQLVGSVEQRFPIFGQRGSAVAAAQADVDVAQAGLAVRTLEVQLEVDRAYTVLAAAQARAALADEAAKLADELAQRTRAKVQNQLAPELELEQASLAARRAAQDARDRQAAIDAARFTLAALLGLAPQTPLSAADPLLPLPQPPQAHGAPPEVQLAQKERAAAEKRADRERAAIRPVPDLTLEVEQLQDPTRVGLRGTVAVEVPLLSQNQGAVQAEDAKAAQADARAQAASLRLEAAREAARVRWEAARARAMFMEQDDVPSAIKVRDLARTASELGRIPFTSLLQAEADVTRARLDAVDAEEAAWDALADLHQATGVAP